MEKVTNRISRRRMLKRIGAGAAVAWSAPILSSLRTPAFAQYEVPGCVGARCGTFTPCSSNPDCVCVDCEGRGFCVPGSTSCAGLTACTAGGGQCPADSCCAIGTCCNPGSDTAGVCIPFSLTDQCAPNGARAARRQSSGAGTVGG
jgi:hypothetical protein